MHTHISEIAPSTNQRIFLKTIIGLVFGGVLYISSLQSYLLFHSMAEMFAISISISIFIITWNTRVFKPNGYLFFVGIGYLSVAIIDGIVCYRY